MGEFKRKSDGRRIFTSELNRATVEPIRSGAAILAEVSRELEIAPSILRNWMRPLKRRGKTAVEAGADSDSTPRTNDDSVSIPQDQGRIREDPITRQKWSATPGTREECVCTSGGTVPRSAGGGRCAPSLD